MNSVSKCSSPSNILVVDDTPASLQVLSGMLEEQGYEVRPAPNGRLALRGAESDPPDLILLDIMMPEMDGYEVCRRLKEDENLRDIPVIFISALTETFDKVKAFRIGGVDYVTKPFQIEEVHARVETHLRLRRLQMESEEQNRELKETHRQLQESQARLIEEMGKELQVAHDVQMGLLPETDPSIPGLDIAGRCIPASSVGGDHYTYVWLDEEKTKFAIVLADVSGKEMKAAMTVMRFTEILHYETQGKRKPEEILGGLNASVYGRLEKRMYVTSCVAVLDVSERNLEVSNAGHPPAYRLSGETGRVEELEMSSYPLGLRQDAGYEAMQVNLEEGDVLVFYTDGVCEARNEEGSVYGFDRLAGVIRDMDREMEAREMIDRILGEVERFTGTSQHEDDLTLVVVKVL